MTDTQLIGDLKTARAALVSRGRCLGKLLLEDGRVCAIGAIGVATIEGFVELESGARQRVVYGERQMRARFALEAHLPPDDVLFLWNDRHSTTDQDVLDLFDKTICDLGGAL